MDLLLAYNGENWHKIDKFFTKEVKKLSNIWQKKK